jgi:hypothetical protein
MHTKWLWRSVVLSDAGTVDLRWRYSFTNGSEPTSDGLYCSLLLLVTPRYTMTSEMHGIMS